MTLQIRKQFQAHPFHLVDPSPWPLIVSFSLLFSAIGAVMSFHGYPYGGYLLSASLIQATVAIVLWLKDIVTEALLLGSHTKEVVQGLKMGIILFIISELFVFVSVFWGYLHSALSPAIEIGAIWPPFGIIALDPFAIPLLNTILLLSSGAFVTYAHHGLIQGGRRAAIYGGIMTIILAIVFTALQYYEYKEATFSISDSVFGTTFFASTGLHGFHVIVGTAFIFIAFIRIVFYQLTRTHHFNFEFAIIYWHFVDIVWLGLFCLVYYWPTVGAL